MEKYQKGYTVIEILIVVCFLIGGIGYIANIVKLVSHLSDPITLLVILRVVGIFAVPLGAILGFL